MSSLRANSAIPLACLIALLPLAWSPAKLKRPASIRIAVQGRTGVSKRATDQEIRTLQSGGAPFERTLAGGQTHSYQITLLSGQYLHVVVDQRGIDVVVAILGPDGHKLAEVDSPNSSRGPEPLSWVAESAGAYRLQVTSPNKDAANGHYGLGPVEVREAIAEDRDRVVAQQAFAEGMQLYLAVATEESRRSAIKKFQLALTLWRTLGERVREAQTLNYIGEILYTLGDRLKALDYYDQALAVFHTADDRAGEAVALNGIGLIYSESGDAQRALDYYHQALPLWHALGDPGDEAVALHNLGLLYADLGDEDKALDYFFRTLPLRRAAGDSRGEAYSLSSIATAYDNIGKKQRALVYYGRALRLRQALHDQRGEAYTLNGMGSLYLDLDRPTEALAYFTRALPLRLLVGDQRGESSTLTCLGNVFARLQDYPKAFEYYESGLFLRRKTGERLGEALTLARMAQADRDRKHLREAQARIEEALTIFESLRGNVGSPELRSSFLASVHARYEFYIDLLLRLHLREPLAGYDRLALEAAQRFRARSFLELMTESKIDLRQDLTKEQQQREAAFLERISGIQKQLFKPNVPTEREQQLKKDLGTAEDSLEEFGMELRKTNPRYAAIHYPEPITLDRLQHELLDADTTLVEYVLGDETSFAWAVSQNSVTVARLPPRKQIERQVSLYRQALMEKTSALTVQPALERVNTQGLHLYRALLQPLQGALGSSQKLIIIPDGLLSYLPFETLLISGGRLGASGDTVHRSVSTGNPKPVFLLQRFAISYAPSASALASVRSRIPDAVSPPMSLLAFGDPLYHARGVNRATEQPNVLQSHSSTPQFHKERGLDLTQLPFTRAEVNAISSLFPQPQQKVYLGAGAREENVKAEKLDQYRYVHFAAHGYVDEEAPVRSGIVLAIAADQKEDGVLQMGEIMRLRLNADLVTLSACRTGLGRLVNGEGVIGLSRAFFYAGARSLVVSLWNVNDMATSELMTSFYQNLNRGLPKDEALRQAKLALIKTHRGSWRHPYFWAPFVLIGDANRPG